MLCDEELGCISAVYINAVENNISKLEEILKELLTTLSL